MKYKYLLFDADETLLDFKLAEETAFSKLMELKGIENSPLLYKQYSAINQSVWERFEKGIIKKENIGFVRYSEFIEKIGVKADAAELDMTYHILLGQQGQVIDGAKELCAALKECGYSINIITNGFADTQRSRFEVSGLNKYIDRKFVSEELGVQKPKKEFFDKVFKIIGCCEKEKYLVIGDSMTADIIGGINAGIDTCWFNRNGKKNSFDVEAVYTVGSFEEIRKLL